MTANLALRNKSYDNAASRHIEEVWEKRVEVSGTLVSIKTYNDRWAIGRLKVSETIAEELGLDQAFPEVGSEIVVVGDCLAGLSDGGDYRLRGKFARHPKFGPQFQADAASVEIAPNPVAIKRFLVRNLHNVGEVSAQKIIEKFQAEGKLEELRKTLLANPLSLDVAAITGRKVKVGIKNGADQGIERFIHRDLAIRLSSGVVNDGTLRRIALWLADRIPSHTAPDAVTRAWEVFAKDPYLPIMSVDGYGFSQADAIGLSLSFPRTHPSRLAALAIHSLTSACETNGHIFLTESEFARAVSEVDASANPKDAVEAAIAQGWPIVVDGQRIYLRKYHFAQTRAANLLKLMGGRTLAPLYRGDALDREIIAAEMAMGQSFRLDPSQRAALRGLLTSEKQIHTLTAGPGCGKTSIMEVMVGVLRNSRLGVFAAPTGKAAKVLNGRLSRHGLTASTIHAMLGVQEDGFIHCETNPLAADYIVVDESSMNDVEIMGHLLAAVPKSAHIIFLGDTNQLPSVGPGQMLADIKALDFDHHELSQTHRNTGGILHVVNQAARGVADTSDQFQDVVFSHGLPPATEASVAAVMADYERAVARHGVHQVALLTARRKGQPDVPGWNTTYLNARLRERLNPNGEKIRGTSFFVGDRIVVRKNLMIEQGKDENDKPIIEAVVNGDTGTIRQAFYRSDNPTDLSHVEILLDDGRVIRFPAESMNKIAHAYAMTVHMSQGSEYAEVLAVITNGMPSFIHRGIVFTAYSRAKRMLRVYAEDDVLRSVVRRPIPRRNSAICELVNMPRTVSAPAVADPAPVQVIRATGQLDPRALAIDPFDLDAEPHAAPDAAPSTYAERVTGLLGW
jgi:exodeoxyribonuclease V alpha subunit